MTTRYTLPAGSHAVSSRGREFIGDANNEVDLVDIDSGTISDLVTYAGLVPVPSDEAKAAAVQAKIDADEFAAASARAGFEAEEAHRLAELVRIDAAEKAKADQAAAQEADAAAVAQAQAEAAAEPLTQVGDDDASPEIDANNPDERSAFGRSITPPRRKRPVNG